MQHERGPRKPKIKESTGSSSSVAASEKSASSSASSSNLSPPIHQTHLHHSTGLPVSFSHTQLAAATAFSRTGFNPPFSFAIDHRSKVPPLSNSSSSEPSSSTDSLYGGGKEHCSLLDCQASAMSASGPSTGPPLLSFDLGAAAAAATASSAQANPGLLQMLLNAEKSQDLLWNLRYSGNAAAAAAALMNSHGFPCLPRLMESSTLTSSLPFPLPVNGNASSSVLGSLPPVRDTLPANQEGTSARNENQSSSSRPNSAASVVTTNGSTTPTPSNINVSLPAIGCSKFTGGPGGPGQGQAQPWDSSHEVTARLLFMVIRWIKSLPTFKTLSKKDQIILLEDAWKDLFLVNMAQWSVSFEITSPLMPGTPAYLSRAIANQKGNETSTMTTDLAYIQEIMKRFRQLSPDGTECSCLKAVILFKPGKIFTLQTHAEKESS